MAGFKKDALHPDCPEDRVLEDVAADASSPEVERQIVRHISQCDVCGPRFRAFLRIESKAPLSAAETSILNQLKTSSPEYQKRWLAKQGIIPSPDGRRADKKDDPPSLVHVDTHHEIKWWPRLAFAGAGLAAVIAGFILVPPVLVHMELRRANKTVDVAFAARRTTEMRYPGAPAAAFHPYPVELGPDTPAVSDFDRPELAKAQGVVADKVKSGDPRWLQLQGRISLLKGDSRSLSDAEKMFEAASKKDPNSASLKIDLASAYFERDSKAEHPNLQKTLDLLLEVLHRPNLNNQDRTAALFDLAIAYEKTQAWDLAVDTWNEYLRVEKSGPWTEQVREHLKEAEEKTRQKRQQGYDAPRNLLDQIAQGTLLAEEPEQYFQKALNLWLPQAVQDSNSEYYRASAQLAEVMEQRSSDTWLKDFLRGVRARDSTAVQALSAASVANEKGLYEAGAEQAHRALDAFKASKNTAGVEMAEFEQVYATRSLLKGKDCLQPAQKLRSTLEHTRHHWLRTQAYLEEAQCQNFQGQIAESDASAAASMDMAKQFHLPVMILRNMGIVASMKRRQGKLDQSWGKAVEGLEVYWKGSYPPERLDQFYSVMYRNAGDQGSLYAEEAILRKILDTRGSPVSVIPRNLIREGLLRLFLANLLKTRNEMDPAALETRRAIALLDSVAESYAKAFRPFTIFGSDQLDLTKAEAKQAVENLLAMRAQIDAMQDKMLELKYQHTLGGAYLRLGEYDKATVPFAAAMKIADSSLDSITNDEDRIMWHRSTSGVYRGMVRVLLAQHKDRQALETWEWYKGRADLFNDRDGANEQKPNLPQRIGSVQVMPPLPGTRLIYAGFADGLQAWLVKGNNITSTWTPLDFKKVEDAVRSFSDKCANPDSRLNELQHEGEQLYGVLLQPVKEQLSETSIVVELDPSTYNLPVEALRTPDGRYLGEMYSIIYSPGIWVENNLRRTREIGSQEPLLLLDATRSSYLPGLDGERKKISGLFPRTKVLSSTSWDAKEFRARLSTSEIFHFMGHGQQDGSGTHLVLSDKLTLGAKDFTPEILQHSQLVVLSACSTGRGEKDGYLDTDSLVHSFLTAGVPSIVSSHWNVDSASSARLMASFYGHLVTDKQPALAMYNARREMLAANAHPYYWAGFSVVGRAI